MTALPKEHVLTDLSEPARLNCGPAQVSALARYALDFTGIRLTDRNEGFFKRRLPTLLARSGYSSLGLYIAALGTEESLRRDFVEALTVHTTSFFRDKRQYDWLQAEGLPRLTRERSTITFWSAAASSGQEGWTALMVADQVRRNINTPFRAKLIATDLSRKVVDLAKRAIYDADEVNGIPQDTVRRYFMHSKSGDGRLRIVPELRAAAEWRPGNLVTGDGLTGIQADVAFLRNVLIYFPDDVKTQVINRVVGRIKPGGYLLTGHSETGFSHRDLKVIEPSIYIKG
ncbi:CheR family methyltransferase [Aestuariivita boseongensis]|uniref:CheR family methyltransferase n=1 Tax=Aestuariivita boseongensis TaxID=1470562 RepID=UPI0006824BC5|nr:CheR family methyltransferase [Aestuariivita boseongensis]